MRNWGEFDDKLETYLKSVEEVFWLVSEFARRYELGEDWLSLEEVFLVGFGLFVFVWSFVANRGAIMVTGLFRLV